MILVKLQEALGEAISQRKAHEARANVLAETETHLRSLIAKLAASSMDGGNATIPTALDVISALGASKVRTERQRDKIDDVADVLRGEGKPMHITAIAERLSERSGAKVDRTEIEPGLNRHISKVKNRRIDKFGPSTFGLPEWQTQPTLAEIA
jgi:hypothetical protein